MNLDRVQKKEKLSSPEYDKDITVQPKKSTATLPKITYPAMMGTCEEYDNNKHIMRENIHNSHMTLPLLRWRRVKTIDDPLFRVMVA